MPLSVTELQRVQYLRSSMMFDAILGNYKNFKELKKEYASLAERGFDRIKQLPSPSVDAPLKTKYGLNMLYVTVRDFLE